MAMTTITISSLIQVEIQSLVISLVTSFLIQVFLFPSQKYPEMDFNYQKNYA